MRLLLDTHIAVWTALDPGRLTKDERRLLERAEGPPVLSAVSIWELRLKWHSIHVSGQPKGPIGPATILAFAAAMGWDLLPLTGRHAVAELAVPLAHKDPFDELLLIQAQEESLGLLTRDAKLLPHPLAMDGLNRP